MEYFTRNTADKLTYKELPQEKGRVFQITGYIQRIYKKTFAYVL
jgi:hypothetical protein